MKYRTLDDTTLFIALMKAAPDCSKTTLRSWLREGRIFVDGQQEKKGNSPVSTGQLISLRPNPRFLQGDIRIIYEDKHLVVVEKPEGLLSVATAFETKNTVHGILKDRYRPKRVFVVHRLDQGTSGLMLFAFSENALQNLKKSFEKHKIKRHYAAIVEGLLEKKSGCWKSFLWEDANYIVHSTKDRKRGREAITHYQVKAESQKYSWLDIELETGKKNQIRLHCKEAGHSVVGDKKYGAKSNPIKRICLHAYLLTFQHPITNKMMQFTSSFPKSFSSLLGTVQK